MDMIFYWLSAHAGVGFVLYVVAGIGICWLAAKSMDRVYGRPRP